MCDVMSVVKADKAMMAVIRMRIENWLLISFLILPRHALTAKAFIGPSNGDSSMAPSVLGALAKVISEWNLSVTFI